MVGDVSFACGHQTVRSFGAVENQVTWCTYTHLRRSAILRETFSLGVITKIPGHLGVRHTRDNTTMFPTRLSLGVGTKNTDRLGVFRHPGDETTLPPGGPLFRRGHQARRDKGKDA